MVSRDKRREKKTKVKRTSLTRSADGVHGRVAGVLPLLHEAVDEKAEPDHDGDEQAGRNETENEELIGVVRRLRRCNNTNKSIIHLASELLGAHFVCNAMIAPSEQRRGGRSLNPFVMINDHLSQTGSIEADRCFVHRIRRVRLMTRRNHAPCKVLRRTLLRGAAS